jgi:hypothetical protein
VRLVDIADTKQQCVLSKVATVDEVKMVILGWVIQAVVKLNGLLQLIDHWNGRLQMVPA